MIQLQVFRHRSVKQLVNDFVCETRASFTSPHQAPITVPIRFDPLPALIANSELVGETIEQAGCPHFAIGFFTTF